MSAVISLCDARRAAERQGLADIRVAGGISLDLEKRGAQTVIARQRERDGYKVRVPRQRGRLEIAMINTGGGVAAGDRVGVDITMGAGADATLTAPAAERIYGAGDEATAAYDLSLTLGAGASLHWLPQETILFNRARVRRRFEVDMAGDATLLLAETLVFGRHASGETAIEGAFRDDWRVRRDGRLVFAEAVRLDGAISETLGLTAVAGKAGAVSTIVLVAPDAENRLERLRAALAPLDGVAGLNFGASACGGRLVVRALGRRSQDLRQLLEMALEPLTGAGRPRVWNC
jgi:urease accessory protein